LSILFIRDFMADIDYDRLGEAVADAITRSGRSQDADIEAKRIIKANEALEKLTKSLKETSTAGKLVERLLKGQTTEYNSLQYAIKDLEDQIEATTNAGEEKLLREKRNELTSDQIRQNNFAAMSNAALGFARMSKEVGNSVASATGGFVKGVQSGQSSFTLSAGLMSGAVDVANQGVQAAAAGIQGVGQIAAGSTKPLLRGLGVAAQLAGVGIGFLGNSASRLAKFGIEVLGKELEKTVAAYQLTSASGAMFADGLQGMRTAAGNAGLTVDQFSKVVSNNSETLASSGLGVGEAAKQMGRVGKVMREQGIDRKLLNLGYSFEEQAGLTAEVMADMRRGNSAALLNPAEISKATEEYATNLRTISAITGEDAKKKMEESRRSSAQIAVRLKLQELEGKQKGITTNFQLAMTQMTDSQKKAINQLMTGEAVTGAEAVMMATNDSFRRIVEGTVAQANSGNFSVSENQQLLARELEISRRDLYKQKDIGIAGQFGKLTEVNQANIDQILQSDKFSKQAVEKAQTSVPAQKETTNELTKKYLDAAVNAQEFAVNLQKSFDPLIKGYATVTAKMLEEINTTFKQIQTEIDSANKKSESKGEAVTDTVGRVFGAAVKKATDFGLIAMPFASLLAMIPGAAPFVAGATAVGAIAAGVVGASQEWLDGKEGKARGGIARGPSDGFIEKLHGSEAVVPLPDGKSIPVTIQTPVTAVAAEEPKPVPATVTVPKEPEPQPPPPVNVTLAVPKETPPPVNVTLAVPKETPPPPVPMTPAVPKESEPVPVVPATPAVLKEPEPVFAKQKLELSGIENIENMARSFVERPTDRLDVGFTQFLSELKMTLDTANASQAKQPDVPVPAPIAEATVLKETIEKTNAVLSDLMREHSNLMRESLAKFSDLVSVSSDNKNINQQMLNNSY
jgi:hypothetical protein